MKRSAAEILREYGPFPGVEQVAGVTYDGQNVWFASGDKLNAFDPESGDKVRAIDVAAHAGTAFDGHHLFQLSGDSIQKIDPNTGRVLTTIPAPGGAGSGLAWAEGALWMGQYRNRKIHQIDPDTGRFFDHRIQPLCYRRHMGRRGALARHSEGDESDLRGVDPQTGEVLERSRYAAGSERVGAGI